MMRHACISTTQKYYISTTVDEIGKLLAEASQLQKIQSGDAGQGGGPEQVSEGVLNRLAEKMLEQIAARGRENILFLQCFASCCCQFAARRDFVKDFKRV